jgi:hypothetical protein
MKTILLRAGTFLKQPPVIFYGYLLIAFIAVSHKVLLDLKPHDVSGWISRINNFIIYRNSFFHLIGHSDLYGYFPAEQYDEFLYSPTFALLVAPLAVMPVYAGVICWGLLNALLVFLAVRGLNLEDDRKVFIHWFILVEMVTSIQNVQVNPIVCSLFLFAYMAFEKKQVGWAALFIGLSIYIKVFGVLAAALFIVYPQRLKFILYMVMWTVVLFMLPLMVISFDELINLYKSWYGALTADHAKNIEDVSVMRMLAGVSGAIFSELTRLCIQLAAVVLFCVQYLRLKQFDRQQARLFLLASAMIWSIIFNHAAESSTYIIAITGVAIWYAASGRSRLELALLILAFVLCSLSPTDIFPRYIRHTYIVPMALKSLPCLLIWLLIWYRLVAPTQTSSASQ